MEQHIREPSAGSSGFLDAGWFDPIEVAIRDRVRGFIETLVEAEMDEALGLDEPFRDHVFQPHVVMCGEDELGVGEAGLEQGADFAPVAPVD